MGGVFCFVLSLMWLVGCYDGGLNDLGSCLGLGLGLGLPMLLGCFVVCLAGVLVVGVV